jgi:hypothetical protein
MLVEGLTAVGVGARDILRVSQRSFGHDGDRISKKINKQIAARFTLVKPFVSK